MSVQPPRSPVGPDSRHRSSLSKRLLSGIAWAFGAKIVGLSSGFAINALLARMLSQEEMGAYFLLSSITLVAAVIARFGLKQTIVRLVAESIAQNLPGRAGATMRIVYLIVSIGVLVVSGGYYIGVGDWLATYVFKIDLLATVTGLTALWIAVLAFQTPVAETFRGLHDIRLATFLDGILASTLLAIILGTMWLFGSTLTFSAGIFLTIFTGGLSVAIGTVLFASRVNEFSGPGGIGIRDVLSISTPIFIANLATHVITYSGFWIVGVYLLPQDIALFGAAWKLVNLVAVPLFLMNMSVQPVIAELYTLNEKSRLQNALRGTATLAGLPALGILLIYILAGDHILALIYGSAYRPAAIVLAVLSIGHLANVWSGACGQVLVFTGHQKQLMFMTLATGALTIVISIIAVKYYGLLGAAVATTIGRILQNGVSWYQVRRLTGLWTHATLHPKFIGFAVQRILAKRSKR